MSKKNKLNEQTTHPKRKNENTCVSKPQALTKAK